MTLTKFTLPTIPKSFLTVKFIANYKGKPPSIPLPAKSLTAEITSAKYIAHHPSVKTKIEVAFHIKNDQTPFQPGDAMGVVCENCPEEVDWLLERLGLREQEHAVCEIEASEGATARQKTAVESLPPRSTPHILLASCCEIRAVCKKVFVRCLAEHATDPEDREGLLELCSREGADKYRKLVQESGLSVAHLLQHFPTCRPPLSLLLEHLPRLCPRYYSVASSPLQSEKDFSIVFTEAVLPGTSPPRLGVCTGWLVRQTKTFLDAGGLEGALSRLSLSPKPIACWLYRKHDHSFPLPADPRVPLILVGPGAGLAPFLGYLRHRQLQKERDPTMVLGDIWLFYGCRHLDHDYIYRKELEQWKEQGILSHLKVSSSRDGPCCRYVQHAIQDCLPELMPLVAGGEAHIRVCGDAVAMAMEVLRTFKLGYQAHTDCTPEEAEQYFKTLRLQGRYLQDIWA